MLLYLIHKIMTEGQIPKMPVYLNSTMAIKATEIFSQHHKEHKLSAAQCEMIDENIEFVRTVEESVELNSVRYPCIAISASGMASGGRVLHHLKTLLPYPRNSVVFAEFQAPATPGRQSGKRGGFGEDSWGVPRDSTVAWGWVVEASEGLHHSWRNRRQRYDAQTDS